MGFGTWNKQIIVMYFHSQYWLKWHVHSIGLLALQNHSNTQVHHQEANQIESPQNYLNSQSQHLPGAVFHPLWLVGERS